MPLVPNRQDVPVTVDASLCIEGCTLCIDVCPLDSLALDPETGKAHMYVDECWYCGLCEQACPSDAITIVFPQEMLAPTTPVQALLGRDPD